MFCAAANFTWLDFRRSVSNCPGSTLLIVTLCRATSRATPPTKPVNPARAPEDRSSPPSSLGRRKELTDKLSDIPHWTLHDLCRTARSLMAKAGVADNIAERTLGHTVGGVHGIYNRHDYFNEKSEALQKLATLIEQIINPPDKRNVVELNAHR